MLFDNVKVINQRQDIDKKSNKLYSNKEDYELIIKTDSKIRYSAFILNGRELKVYDNDGIKGEEIINLDEGCQQIIPKEECPDVNSYTNNLITLHFAFTYLYGSYTYYHLTSNKENFKPLDDGDTCYEKKPLANKFADIKRYNSDPSLYLFFRLNHADPSFYQHCLAILDGIIGTIFKSYFLIPRGSFSTKTGLKSTIDLDVDLVLAKEFEYPSGQNGMNGGLTESEFPRVLSYLDRLITQNKHNQYNKLSRNNNKEITRSLEYQMDIEGVNISVDLFPKLISEKGELATISHASANGMKKRVWEYSKHIDNRHKKEFNECEIAAIIFTKLYKMDVKECEFGKSIIWFMKGYHICIALERVLEMNKETTDLSEFNARNVFTLMDKISSYLLLAYDLDNQKRLQSDYIFNEIDPFLEDTTDMDNNERNILIGHIHTLCIEVKDLLNTHLK